MGARSQQPRGQVLLFGPSFSGKSYLAKVFKETGLEAYDLEKEGKYIYWVNDRTGKPVSNPPKKKSTRWLLNNHFLMDRHRVRKFLARKSDCIVFAHSWNILDCLDLFTRAYFMYISPKELEKRMKERRSDHKQESKAQLDFMISRHRTRLNEAKRLNIPIIDVSQNPKTILESILLKTKVRDKV